MVLFRFLEEGGPDVAIKQRDGGPKVTNGGTREGDNIVIDVVLTVAAF